MSGIDIGSDAFDDHTFIDRRHAYEAANVSPPLRWSGVPEDAEELVLLCEDADAPSGAFVHWIVAGIDPRSEGVGEGEVPPRGTELVNGYGERGWGGPHPPPGDDAHHYVFRLYALAEPSALPEAPRAPQVREVVERARIAEGMLVGLYAR